MNAPATPRDFPDWLGPMLVKELRQGLKTRAFVISFIGLQAIFLCVIIYHTLLFQRNGASFEASGLSAIFWALIILQLLIITPCRAFNELAGERKANTLELTFMTGLTPWGIAVGKWASLVFQAMLFLLAVLPYAILRYYFGGVNLIEDLLSIGVLVMLCAILSAAAIAISGLPLVVRIVAMVLAFFFSTSAVPTFFFAITFGRSSFGGSIFSLPDANWPLLWFDTIVLCAAALEIGAAAIAPQAENHAARQRLISFAALLPIPLLFLFKGSRDLALGQLIFFEFVAGFTVWHQLAAAPSQLRRHLEPFAKFGPAGFIAGAFFQPGWPSAALYLLVIVGVMLAAFTKLAPHLGTSSETSSLCAVLLIGAAAQLTAPLIWRAARRRGRWQLVEYVLFQVVLGIAAIFLLSLKPDTFHYGTKPLWAALPPLGMWMLMDDGLSAANAGHSFTASLVSFLAYFLCLEAFAIGYWRRSLASFCEIRRERKPALAVADEAAAG